MSNKLKYEMWDIAARLCACVFPLGASLYFFPEWLDSSPRATFSGMLLVAVLVCMIPFWKKLVSITKSLSSTSMPVFWLIVFAVFFCLREILDKMIYISIFGLIGSAVSMGICIIRNKYGENSDKESGDK